MEDGLPVAARARMQHLVLARGTPSASRGRPRRGTSPKRLAAARTAARTPRTSGAGPGSRRCPDRCAPARPARRAGSSGSRARYWSSGALEATSSARLLAAAPARAPEALPQRRRRCPDSRRTPPHRARRCRCRARARWWPPRSGSRPSRSACLDAAPRARAGSRRGSASDALGRHALVARAASRRYLSITSTLLRDWPKTSVRHLGAHEVRGEPHRAPSGSSRGCRARRSRPAGCRRSRGARRAGAPLSSISVDRRGPSMRAACSRGLPMVAEAQMNAGCEPWKRATRCEPAQHVGQVRAEHAAVGVQLVDAPRSAGSAKKPRPAGVVRQDARRAACPGW